MSKMQDHRRKQAKLARLEIVSRLLLRQHSVRQIRDEVMKRLDLETYSTSTVQKDIETCLQEFKEERLKNTEDAVNLEIRQIDETCRVLWEEWERSKTDAVKTKKRQRGAPKFGNGEGGTNILEIQNSKETQERLGNVAYIAEIRAQQQEKRKLLGLYKPEKQEISGEMSFASLLMQTGISNKGGNDNDQ